MEYHAHPSNFLVSVLFGWRFAGKIGALPMSHGYLVHAAFLNTLHQLQPEVSQFFHDVGQSLTFSSLVLPDRQFVPARHLRCRDEVSLRVTSLHPRASMWLLNPPADTWPNLDVVGQPFELISLHAQHVSWEELWTKFMADPVHSKTAVYCSLDFVSPTSFRQRAGTDAASFKRNVALPIPELIWTNLQEKWNDNAPKAYQLQVEPEAFDQWISVARFDALNTSMVRFKDGSNTWTELGFTGKCKFHIHAKAPLSLIKTAQMLAEFAYFSGIGTHTSYGMGQIQLPEYGM